MTARLLSAIGIGVVIFLVISSCSFIKKYPEMSDIHSIAWQENAYLWVSETDKLIRWNTKTQQAEIFQDISGRLLVDSKNTLWVFDKDRIYHFDGQIWEHFTPNDDFVEGYILSVAETDECIWLGTFGLSCYDKQNELWSVILDSPPGFDPTPIPEDIIVETLLPGIHSIASDGKGLWIGSNGGLTYLDNNHQQTWGNDILKANGIPCLLKTSQNELWLCTENGVGLWDGFQWANFEDLPEPLFLVQGKEKEVWVVTRKVGISRWNGVSWDWWTTNEGISGLRPKSLVVSRTDSNIWVGTEKGISRWDENHWRTYKTLDGLPSDYINIIFQDPQGTLWAGTNNGLGYYDSDSDKWRLFPDE